MVIARRYLFCYHTVNDTNVYALKLIHKIYRFEKRLKVVKTPKITKKNQKKQKARRERKSRTDLGEGKGVSVKAAI